MNEGEGNGKGGETYVQNVSSLEETRWETETQTWMRGWQEMRSYRNVV